LCRTPDSHSLFIPIPCRDSNTSGFIEKVVVLCNPHVNRYKILGILLGLIKPEGDFNVVFHSLNLLNLTKSINQIQCGFARF